MRQQPEMGLLLSAIPTEDNSKTEALIKVKLPLNSAHVKAAVLEAKGHIYFTQA